jgi:hypothetical protein
MTRVFLNQWWYETITIVSTVSIDTRFQGNRSAESRVMMGPAEPEGGVETVFDFLAAPRPSLMATKEFFLRK